MSRRERLAAAIDRLADVIPGGHLMAATDPAELLTQAADAITATARVVEAAVRARARWGRNVTINDLRVIGIDEDTLTIFAAVDELLAEQQR